MLRTLFLRIRRKERDNASPPVLICALGDSVTQGCMEAGAFDFRHVYHHILKGLLEARFPQATFSVLNAGVGGQTAADGLKRLSRDVIRHDPALTLVAFGLNDATRGLAALPAYRRRLRRLVARIRAGCRSDVVLVTPGFMATRRNPRIAPQHRRFAPAILRAQNEGVLRAYVEALRETAREEGVPVADVHAEWERLARRGRDTDALLVNGLNHPDRTGHRLAARTVLRTLLANGGTQPEPEKAA